MNRPSHALAWLAGAIAGTLFALAVLGVAGAHGSVTPSGARIAAATPPRARLRSIVCRRALDPPSRQVSVVAVMRPVSGTVAMAIRFELLERAAGRSGFSVVHAGDLGTWITPTDPATLGQRPGDVWVLQKPVVDLGAPATYRFRVTFRWTGARGRVLRTSTAQTGTCFQPELRPNVRIDSVASTALADHPNEARYTVAVSNTGATAAGSFAVTFSPGEGAAVRAETIKRLAAHTTRKVVFTGPACTSASAPLFVADPAHAINDPVPSDNSLEVPANCPATTTQTVPVPFGGS